MEGFRSPVALVIVNLGTPQQPTPGSVRRFLKQFLSDPRVVEIPRPVWWLILNAFVLPFRPKRVAEAYASIWHDEGSPLRVITERQQAGLQERLTNLLPGQAVNVRHAMTYGQPAIADVLDELQDSGHRRILILPLYPQYSASTTASIYDQIADYIKARRLLPGLQLINSYFHKPAYIKALAESIRTFWQQQGRAQKLMFSFHGIPQSYVDKGDPYVGHCQCTAAAVAQQLQLDEADYVVSFQSRFGKAEWVKPYTDQTVMELAQGGLKTLDVVCPGFAADCLETIEEIGVENRDLFIEHGGEALHLIPCLNEDPGHLDALAEIVIPHLTALS